MEHFLEHFMYVNFANTFGLICLAFFSVEAHAEAEGIDGEWEDYCRTLLCRDRIECLQRGRCNFFSAKRQVSFLELR